MSRLARRHRSSRIAPLVVAIALFVTAGALSAAAAKQRPRGQTTGPDVTVINLTGISNNGVSGNIRGYSIGTTSCNVGDVPVWWCNSTTGYCQNDQHPVIAQNMFRIKDGRFEQIGMSWLKHGFLSTNSPSSTCLPGVGCQGPPHGGDQLGVGCTDTYGSSLNGSRPLGMRSEVNATQGTFPYPYTTMPFSGVDEWVQVDVNDLDPTLNTGARYFAEGHYVAADDAQANNGFNNASWSEMLVGAPPTYNLTLTGGTVREQSALRAWPTIDPAVQLVDLNYFGKVVQRFEVARKVTNPSAGVWHWEIAIHNVNSEQAARALRLDFPDGTQISNVGFHDIDHHSGEPYSTTDWTIDTNPTFGTVSWETETWAQNHDANALRWSTTFSFWFDVDTNAEPYATLELFEPDPAIDYGPLKISFPPLPGARAAAAGAPLLARSAPSRRAATASGRP